MAPHRGQRRLFFQSSALFPQTLAVHPVVGIHSGDQWSRARFEAGGESVDQTAPRSAQQAKPWVALGVGCNLRSSRVVAPVVDDDALECLQCLA